MESKSFSESWQDYTIRDKILFGSSILPCFVSLIHALFWTPVIGGYEGILWDLGFIEGGAFSLIYYGEGDWCDSYDAYWICSSVTYVINPFWLLLSSISIAIYGFYLFRDEPSSSPSALFRTWFFLTFAAIAQIYILFFHIATTNQYESGILQGVNVVRGGEGEVELPPIIPFTYLYLPNLIATISLAYYSRIKNEEENADFIETASVSVGEKSVSGGEPSPVTESHVFLVITIVGGMFGLDKAYKGDYVLAVLKFLTLGGLWIWQIYDIYVAAGEAGRSWTLDPDSSLTTEKHVILVTAIVGGHLGLDRAYKGDGVTGVFKLLTLGGLGIWWLVDVYVAAKEAGESW